MGAWIETPNSCLILGLMQVAPYMGAWIETYSLPIFRVLIESLPTWGRGLKHSRAEQVLPRQEVAPYMGAWIETLLAMASVASSIGRSLHGGVD